MVECPPPSEEVCVSKGVIVAAVVRPVQNLVGSQSMKKAFDASQFTPIASYLAHLADGPYLVLASMLDATALCQIDAACCLLSKASRGQIGPWRSLGSQIFKGLELEQDGLFDQADDESNCRMQRPKLARVDWKGRFGRFRTHLPRFSAPFRSAQISAVEHDDKVASFGSRVLVDALRKHCPDGFYLEVEVIHNADSLSLSVVDFAGGGRSSVTFSPDKGAVVRERQISENPRRTEGAYVAVLPALESSRLFHGLLGMYIVAGRIAFFRRCVLRSGLLGPWETTGIVSDLNWAEGNRLTPTLAFRNKGAYCVEIMRMGAHQPPLPIDRANAEIGSKVHWRSFNVE